jgi:hypothetical protein
MTKNGSKPTYDYHAIMNGAGLPFEHEGATFYVKPPTIAEYDEALRVYEIVLRGVQAEAESAGSELDSGDVAMRWAGRELVVFLAPRIVCTADGNLIVDAEPNSPEYEEQFNRRFTRGLLRDCEAAIGEMMQIVDSVPFGYHMEPEPA